MGETKPARKLVLHAGLPKTATTTVQNAIFASRDQLRQETGVLYPGAEANHTNSLCTAFLTDPRNHVSNKIAGRNDLDALKAMAAGIRDTYAEEIRRAEPDTVFFSAEGMANLNAQELEAFRLWAEALADEVEVFYIIRNPINHATSVMQQHLKGGEVLEDMYANPPLPNWKGRIGSAVKTFGRERVSVHTFEEMVAFPAGVTAFILNLIGVSQGPVFDKIVESEVRENESLSHEAALILSSLNRQRPAFVDGRVGPRRTMNELAVIEKIRGVKFYLPGELNERIAQDCQNDLVWMKDTFGLDLYRDELKKESDKKTPQLSRVAIDSIAVCISNLVNERAVNGLLAQGRQALKTKDQARLPEIAAEIIRLMPNRKLPGFLADVLPD